MTFKLFPVVALGLILLVLGGALASDRRHGGALEVKRKPGRGTSMRLRLPLA